MITKVQKRHRYVAVLLLFIQLLGVALETVSPFGSTALAMAPDAQLVISPATAARLQAQLAQAEAILTEAKLRVQQAQTGQGGFGARPEDIAAAEAAVVAARVALRLRQPFDDVRLLQGPILLFDGTMRAAQSLKDGCGDLEATTRIYLDDQELDTKLHIAVNCPDENKDALDAAIDLQKSLKKIAELTLKRYTKPGSQVENFLVPFEQDVKKAELELQKLKSGGPRDQAALELNVSRAQADVDALKAALSGSLGGMLQAQLTRAEAELKEALYRVEQAKAGTGGVDVRAEDIGMAEADVVTAKANLALFLNPLAEDVGKAQAVLAGAQAAERYAEKTLAACGKGKVTITLKENDDGDISFLEFVRESRAGRLDELGPRQRQRGQTGLADRNPPDFEINLPGLPPILIDFLRKQLLERLQERIEARLAELKAKIEEINGKIVRTRELITATRETLQDLEVEAEDQCTGDQKDELESAVAEAGELKTIAEQQLKLLTNPSVAQISHYVITLQQEVVVAQARLQKLKTGGLQDDATLKRNVARAQADVDGLKAVLSGSLPGMYRAQVVGAQAELAEATYRIEQAKAGTGGIGARTEDIAIAEAGLVIANETLQKIIDPLPELIAVAQANVAAKTAAVTTAQKRREACNRLITIATTRLETDNDNNDTDKLPEKTFTSQDCSGHLKNALEFATDRARAEKVVAEQTLKKLVDPSEKLISYLVGPATDAITIAATRLQKLKTGGLLDQTALELRRARAQAEVDFWQAAAEGAPKAQIEAQIRAAQAELVEAEYRQTQAQNGQGGADARAEDIAMAESLLSIATTRLTAILNPIPEDVLAAQAGVTAALAGVEQAKEQRDACDDPTVVSVRKEDRDDDDPREHRVSQLNCPDGLKTAKDAQVDVARADLEVAEMQFQLLTAPVMPQIGYVIAPYQQSVVSATARVQKLKTGGSQDRATLTRNVALARATLDRFRATLAGSPGGIVTAWIASAQAVLEEAQYRVTQAQSGQGGPDVRAEDIVMAEADAAAAQANFLAIVNPLEETVQTARARLEAAEAGVRAAEGLRKACGDVKLIGQQKVDGRSGDRRTVTEGECSDSLKQSMNWGSEKARLDRDGAFQQLKLLIDPGMPQILYVIAPLQQAAVASAAQVQKLKTGGNSDGGALDLRVSLAQSNLAIWTSLAGSDPAGLLTALIGGAMSVHAEAIARQAQAQAGLGGPADRVEDIAIAEANFTARGAELQQYLTPPQEIVESARIAIEANKAQTEQARHLKRACDTIHLETTIQDGEDKDGDPKEGPVTFKTNIKCSDDQQDALRALEEGIEGFRLVPIAAYSLLTELETNEKLQVLVTGKKSELAIATAKLQKSKTGGAFDASLLQLGVTVGETSVQCNQAFAVEASQGALPTPQAPYSWAAPLPCSLGQLPGKLPPFMQQNVMPTAAQP